MFTDTMESPLGQLKISSDGTSITGILFTHKDRREDPQETTSTGILKSFNAQQQPNAGMPNGLNAEQQPNGGLPKSLNAEQQVKADISKDLTGDRQEKPDIPQCLKDCKTQLQEYFSGQRQQFDLPLAPAGTPFQQKVWQQLLQIHFGHTITYAEIARRLGDPKTIRAAGTANGKNPIAIVIPCHRVIGMNGDLVGYAGGLPNKKWLLDHEMTVYRGISQLTIF